MNIFNKFRYFILITFVLVLASACSQQRYPQTSDTRQPAYSSKSKTKQATTAVRQQKSNPPRFSSQQRVPQYTPVVSNNPVRNKMVKIAKSALGVPYKWGGNSPREGFDCSGLMRYVHQNAGLKIPRTTASQRDTSRTINYAELKPGDMLFFKIGRKTNHVGVYIGNRKFIHAPSSGKRVTVATMDSSYWHKRFVKFGTFL